MIDLKKWHVVRDIRTGRRSCCYYDKDEPTFDFGEPDPMEGKEEVPLEEWSSKEITDIISSVFEYSGVGKLAFLPETVLQAMEDCNFEESKKVDVMRGIMNAIISEDLD